MKAQTAYFVFMEEQRPLVRAEILKERGEGAKLSVGDIAKVIGKKWKEISEEDKDAYKLKAQAQGQAAAAAAEEQGGNAMEPDEAEGPSKEPSPLDALLPISMVRRIILADPDASRVAHEGIVAVAMATNLLLGLLAKHSASNAKSSKRRTIMLKDFTQAVKQDRRLAQAGLRDVEAAVKAGSEAEATLKAKIKESAIELAETEKAGQAADGDEADGHEEDEGAGLEGEQAEAENLDPEGEPAKDAGDEGDAPIQKRKRGRPQAGKEKAVLGEGGGSAGKAGQVAGSKRKLAEQKAMLGVRKIDSFFSKQ